MTCKTHAEKSKYLVDLFRNTYIKDVIERHKILNDSSVLDDLLKIVSSSIGSLTNPTKLSNTFGSERQIAISPDTIETYLGYFADAFLLHEALRYDVKGKKYMKTPLKYYFTDKKIVVVNDYMNPWRDDNGILYIGVEQFLLDENSLNL